MVERVGLSAVVTDPAGGLFCPLERTARSNRSEVVSRDLQIDRLGATRWGESFAFLLSFPERFAVYLSVPEGLSPRRPNGGLCEPKR